MPVKKWEVSKKGKKEKTAKDKDKDKSKDENSLLQVMLDYGVEKKYEFTITSELVLKDASGRVTMPVFNSLVDFFRFLLNIQRVFMNILILISSFHFLKDTSFV